LLLQHLETRASAPDVRLEDAFELAIELENSEINDVYAALTALIDGPTYVIKQKIRLSIDHHFKRLLEAACKFGASPETQMRLAELLSHTTHETNHGSGC
jgi:hypothetical protein